jgi:cobalt-zinc-cadmium resistance protein CzcA
MLTRLVEFCLRQRGMVLLATAILVGVGFYASTRLPIDAVPDITNIQVQINTAVPALAPEEIEQLVTFPLESELSGIQGMVELRSLSKFGLSQINLIFEDGIDVYRARQLVSERLQHVELPEGLQPKLAPVLTGLGDIYFYTLDFDASATNKPQGRQEQLMQLRQINEMLVKPQLRSVHGVSEVNSIGGYQKQYVVFPYPQKMSAAGLSFNELADRVSENVKNTGGGIIQIAGEQVAIRTTGRVQSIQDIESIPLKFRAGSILIRVKDVASVGIGSATRTGAATHNGQEAVIGGTLMLIGENSRAVASRVHAKTEDIQDKLPAGVVLRTLYNRTDLVNGTIRTVEKNLFEGALLVVAVLFAMLGNWRAALIVALAIPLSMLMAITGMVENKISGNLMSLGAIDFGLIIDGSVVMVENIFRHLAEKQKQFGRTLTAPERKAEVLKSSREVVNPMFFGVAIITLVYVPILSLSGIEGKMFRPMAWTVIFALGASLVLAVTIMPVLCSFFLSGKLREQDNWLVAAFKSIYRPILLFALRFRLVVVLLSAALFGSSLIVYSHMGAEFVPQLDESSFLIQMIRTTSIGLDSSLELQRKAEQLLLKEFPEVSHVFAIIGTSDIGTDPMGANVSDTYTFFAPNEKWRKVNGRAISKDELADLINRRLSVLVPAQSYLFTQPIEMRFNEMLEGTRADVAIKVMGNDYAELERISRAIGEVVEKVSGAADVEFDAVGKSPMLEIIPKRDALAKFNVHNEDINKVVSTALAGREAGTIIEGNQRFPIMLRLTESTRHDIEAIKRLPLKTENGGLLTLSQVADVQFAERVSLVQREAGQRRAAILVNLRGRDVEGFVQEARARIKEQVKLPDGYFVEFGGQFKNLQQAKARLRIVVPAALALIFTLIFFSFHSFRQAALIFVCVPLATAGGIFALAMRGLPFSISAAVGFIALSGIAVLNGIMLISFINQLRAEGKTLRESVLEGSLTRLRPKLMTAFVASLGFVPMAIAAGAGSEVQRPLATVVIGGIVSSTFLTLVLLPTLYEWMEGHAEQTNTKGESTA